MTAPIVEQVDLPDDIKDWQPACAINEIMQGDPPPCGRPATLALRFHECGVVPACQPCWNRVLAAYKAVPAGTSFICHVCKKMTGTFEEMVWPVTL